jgi:Txe/YoeB family toxin of Txe-Axe toxin-antitoxin module
LREKLQIKSEALNLLAKQIEICNKEKTEYKRLIDTLYDKNLTLKKKLYFKENEVEDSNELADSSSFNSAFSQKKLAKKDTNIQLSPNNSTSTLFTDIESEDYMKILKDLVKSLQKEKYDIIQKYEELQQQLQDSRSDLRLLREQIVRQRIGTINEGLTYSPVDITPTLTQSISPSTVDLSFRENLIKEIEQLREQKQQVEAELNLVQCQKEEIEIERDSFKNKFNELNKFLVQASQDFELTGKTIFIFYKR